jgi:hypothetical protein
VAQHGSGSVAELVDDVGDVFAEIIEDDTGHRPGGLSDPARLRPQHAVARADQGGGERLEVITSVSAVGRDSHHGGSGAVDIGFDR